MELLNELSAKLNVVSAAAGQKKAPRKAASCSADVPAVPEGADPNDPNSVYLAKLVKRPQGPTYLQYMAGNDEEFFKTRFSEEFIARVSDDDPKVVKTLKSGNMLEFRRAVAHAYWKSLDDAGKGGIRTEVKAWRNEYLAAHAPKGVEEE